MRLTARAWRWAGQMLGGGRSAFQPHFDADDLWRTLAASGDAVLAGLARTAAAAGSAEQSRLRAESIEHLTRQLEGRFFVDRDTIVELAGRLAGEHPDWVAALLARVRADLEDGLDLYSARGPVLGAEFPWGGLARGPGGDKLYAKRPHRFFFAPRLTQAGLYAESTDAHCGALLDSWIAYAGGRDNALAYDSNLAVIQRIVALSWAWMFAAGGAQRRGRPAPGMLWSMLKILVEDLRFLATRLGDSYANNHLLADGFGGWFAAVLWPALCPAGWRERYGRLWLCEFERQVYPDGTSFEHSAHYHEFACEMGLAYRLLSRRNALALPDWADERIRRLLQFQAALGGPEGRVVAVGDALEEPIFPLDPVGGAANAAWRAALRREFGATLAAEPADDPVLMRAWWLLGGLAPCESHPPRGPALVDFPDGGFYFFHEAGERTRLSLRTGPAPGTTMMAGHADADLLSVTLSVDGERLLVDAGTASYRRSAAAPGGHAWRGYLRSARAHNTVALGERDPFGDCTTDFRPADTPVRVAIRRHSTGGGLGCVEAEVLGGACGGLRRGVVHVVGEYWLIYDVLPADSSAQAELRLQFDSPVALEQRGEGKWLARVGATALAVNLHGWQAAAQLHGSEAPPGGWIAPRYGARIAAPQLCARADPGGTARVVVLRWGDRQETLAIEAEHAAEGIGLRVTAADWQDVVMLARPGQPFEFAGHAFDGTACWLRRRAHAPAAVRWHDGARLSGGTPAVRLEARERLATLAMHCGADGWHATAPEALHIETDRLHLRLHADRAGVCS